MRREDLGLAGYRDESSAFVRFLWVTASIRSSYARSHRVAGGVAGLPSDGSGWGAYSRLMAAFRSVRLGRDVRPHRNGSFQQDEMRSSTDDPVIFSAPPADRVGQLASERHYASSGRHSRNLLLCTQYLLTT